MKYLTGLSRLRVLLLICAAIFKFQFVWAQSPSSFCATTGGTDATNLLPPNWPAPLSSPLYIRIYVYKVGNAAGQFFPPDQEVLESVSTLRRDFEPYNIFFVWNCSINTVRDDTLNNMDINPGGPLVTRPD